jgi:hypothetical protein
MHAMEDGEETHNDTAGGDKPLPYVQSITTLPALPERAVSNAVSN